MKDQVTCNPVESVSRFVEMVKPHSKDPRIRYYYRGEPRTEDNNGPRKLIPALLRPATLGRLSEVHGTNDPVSIQRNMLSRLQRYVPLSLWTEASYSGGTLTGGDRLCVAQHYGLPTLLLDWTLSPLAALYFAVTKHESNDGRIWFMRLKPKCDRELCTRHLEDENQDITDSCETPELIVPKPFNRRIEVQVARFIYFGKCATPLEDFPINNDLPFEKLSCVTVLAKDKAGIMHELTHHQVHGGTMFPGLDGYARYLAEGGL